MQHAVGFPVVLVTRLQRKFKLRVAEWMTAIMLVSWGVALAARPVMLQEPFYVGFRWASQTDWTVAAMLIGFGRLSALMINGSWRFSSHLRALLTVASVFIWFGLIEGVLKFGKPTLAIALCPWLALADLYAVWRASRDAQAADDDARYFRRPR